MYITILQYNITMKSRLLPLRRPLQLHLSVLFMNVILQMYIRNA